MAGPIALTFDGAIVGQVGWSGSPEQWGISLDDSTDTVDVRLADDSTVPMTWLLSIADTDGSGPRLPFLTIRFDGPVVREGDTGRHEVSLEYGWQSEAPPGSSIGTPIGALEFDGTTASFDVELLGPLRDDPRAPIGTVTAVGAVDCP